MQRYFGVIFVLALLLLNIFIWSGIPTSASERYLTVAFLDIGQGDAIFIESPTGVQTLVDSGRNASVLRELGKVMPFQDRSIDVLVATHPDADHIGGFPAVLENYDVDTYIDTGAIADTGVFREVHKAVEEEGSTEILARRGMVLDMGAGVTLTILFPDRDVSHSESNEGSIVAKLEYGDTTFILTGDSPQKIERYLVSLDGDYLDVDILKPGHHGSKTSSSDEFIKMTSPEYSVISAGKDNRYGHPNQETLDVLNKYKSKILATYEDGTVIFESNGEEYWIK